MGSSLRLRCSAFLRALLLPSMLALAWLIWGAGTAQASSLDSDTAQLNTTSLGSGLLSSGPSSDLTGAVAGTLSPTVHKVVPAFTPPAAPELTRPVTRTISAVTTTTDVVVGGVAGLASSVVNTAAPVVSQVDKAVAAVDDAVASLDPRLPQTRGLHVPVPVPVPVATVPEVPVQQVPPRAVSTTVPAVPGTARPAAPVPAAAVSSAGDKANDLETAAPAPAVVPVQQTGLRGPTLAQLLMTATARPVAAVAVQPLPFGLLNPAFALEHVNLAATHGESSSAGSDGPGAQAADIAAFWNELSQNAGEREHDAAMELPSSPAFDPGSSPD